MSDVVPLGTFEEQVMLAVVRTGDGAYGMNVRRELETVTGREVTIGAVYATLDRLADKGLVAFSVSSPQPVRVGRARKHAALTPAVRRALRATARGLARMLDGLRVLPEGR